jgi:hypothetical protein
MRNPRLRCAVCCVVMGDRVTKREAETFGDEDGDQVARAK